MKGLLLGTAAGLVAMTGAQAADLPVKAKPVEYVKVCSLYGAGFFYVPGTDTCLKIGMYLRADSFYGRGNAPGYYMSNTQSRFTRTDTDYYGMRSRINLTTDWRTQTDYGVLRAYAAIIAQNTSGGGGDAATTGVAGILRAFIQFAGFTVGHAVSYFDFFNGADYGYLPSIWIGSTGVNGTNLLAYTWQLGNGWSASIDVEDPVGGRAKRVVNASAASVAATTVTTDQLGAWMPDVAGNIRIDQAWGSAQIMAAYHDASGGYYSAPLAAGAQTVNGHPGQASGWAIGGGFKLNNFLMPKDVLEFQIDYAKGATGYVWSQGLYGAPLMYGSGNNLGIGYSTDGVFVTGGGVQLTESWGMAAAYQHYWNAQWRTAVVGGYTEINYGSSANAALCGAAGSGGVFYNSTFALASGACNMSFSMSSISTRTAWNPHPTLEIGLDLIWNHLNTAMDGAVLTQAAANGARPAGPYTVSDQDAFIGVLRVQKTVLHCSYDQGQLGLESPGGNAVGFAKR
jgi:hypothetical protein